MGIGSGAFVTVSPMFVEEMAPRRISGSLGTLNQFSAVFSVLFLT